MENLNFKIDFVKASGYYQPDPIALVHVWNRSSSEAEAVRYLLEAWDHFKQSDRYISGVNNKGKKTDPKISVSNLRERAKNFRKKGVYMKAMPKQSTSRYNWQQIIEASMVYKNQQSTFNF